MGKPIQHIVWILTLNNQSFKALSMALKGLTTMTYDEAIERVLLTIFCRKHKIEDIKSIQSPQHMVELLEILFSCLRTVVWFDMAVYEELLTEHTKEEIRTMNFYPSVWLTKHKAYTDNERKEVLDDKVRLDNSVQEAQIKALQMHELVIFSDEQIALWSRMQREELSLILLSK